MSSPADPREYQRQVRDLHDELRRLRAGDHDQEVEHAMSTPNDEQSSRHLSSVIGDDVRAGLDEQPAPLPRRRAMTQREMIESLLAALARTQGEHGSVELTRNARGDVQIRVAVRTGENGVESVEDAATKARQVYDQLAALYPIEQSGGAA